MDRREKKIGSAKQFHHLVENEGIIEEILSRLPVKTLLRFQSASKAWASLIGSERFIKVHLQNSRKNTDLSNHRVIYDFLPSIPFSSLRKWKINELKRYSVHSLMNDPVPEPFGLEHLSGFGIVGCCNGLVCVRYPRRESFYLWNPSTRIWFELPKLEKEISIVRSGFGWDESSGAYKVFVFLRASVGENSCMVYRTNTNEWEKVETSFHWGYHRPREDGLLVNGKLHWHDYGGNAVLIVSLDLKSEERTVIGTMDHPCDYERLHKYYVSLGVVWGCLSVAQHHGKRIGELDIWVMKEYGVKESWYRAMTVRLHHLMGPHYEPSYYSLPGNVLGEGPDGEILISYDSHLLAYHPKKHDDAVVLRLEVNKKCGRARAHLYSESLVSLERVLGKYASQVAAGPFCHRPKRNTQKPIKLKDYVLK